MKRFSVRDLFSLGESLVDETIEVCGWLRSVRNSKAFSFLSLSDGSCHGQLQIVVDEATPNYADVAKLLTGSAVRVAGKVVKSPGKEQSVELQATEVEIFGEAPNDYPLQKKRTSLEFLREISHLRARSNTIGAVFRVRHQLAMATHEFFDSRGYFYLHTPVITASDCEGAGEMFRVSTLPAGEKDFSQDYFGEETYLTVSGQLEAEAYALAMGKVYTFGPTFRSENSNTTRHLAEFWMVEPEVAFADLDDVAELAVDYIRFMIERVLKECRPELEFFQKFFREGLIDQLTKVVEAQVTKITYTEAIEVLKNSGKKFEYSVEWGSDLQTEHERFLAEEHFNGPVIVTDYPKEIKSFYMRLNDDGKTVRAMDVLVPGVGELIGGSQREERYDVLKDRMVQSGLNTDAYQWYLDLRRYGGAPHSGFGLGFERAIMYMTGMSNIRDVIAFPRFPGNAKY